jgi:Fur family ferric uptake transcriptional regulator
MVVQRRNTAQRAEILHILDGTDGFISAQDLHAALRTRGSGTGLATVYRALQDMVGGGDLDTVRKDSGEVLYRQCADSQHHHHLVCRSCGRTEEVEAPGVERWARSVAADHGFVELDHELELFGLCPDCAARRADDRPPSAPID